MLTKDEVRYIASLSRVHLEDDEVEHFTRNLADILHYIDQLNKLDVSQVAPTSHALPLKNVYRQDIIQPSLPQSAAVKISQNQLKGFFKVPKVIE